MHELSQMIVETELGRDVRLKHETAHAQEEVHQ